VKRQLRRVVGTEANGDERLECGHAQAPRWAWTGRRTAKMRECDTCQDAEFAREGEIIAAFGGPRLL
jgi:hypothetical protein